METIGDPPVPVERAPGPERRQAPRLEVLSTVRGEVDGDATITLLNVSTGGLLIAAPMLMEKGETHEIAFDAGGGTRRAFAAEVVHVMRGSRQGDATFYVGLKFVPPNTEQQRHAIEYLMTLGGAGA